MNDQNRVKILSGAPRPLEIALTDELNKLYEDGFVVVEIKTHTNLHKYPDNKRTFLIVTAIVIAQRV